MKHVQREAIEAAVATTCARLDRIASTAHPADDPLRDVVMVMSRHAAKTGQEELADKLDDFLIGYTNPAAEPVKVAS